MNNPYGIPQESSRMRAICTVIACRAKFLKVKVRMRY